MPLRHLPRGWTDVVSVGTEVAIGLAAWAGIVALFALVRPVESRHGMTMRLSLTLLRYDEGLGLLAVHSDRADRWWDDAAGPRDRPG